MNNNGIACKLYGNEGRIKNLHYNPIEDEVKGDFYYRNSNTPVKTSALNLVPVNKKADKALQNEINQILEKEKKKNAKKETILS